MEYTNFKKSNWHVESQIFENGREGLIISHKSNCIPRFYTYDEIKTEERRNLAERFSEATAKDLNELIGYIKEFVDNYDPVCRDCISMVIKTDELLHMLMAKQTSDMSRMLPNCTVNDIKGAAELLHTLSTSRIVDVKKDCTDEIEIIFRKI
jgi:hypothetical protein